MKVTKLVNLADAQRPRPQEPLVLSPRRFASLPAAVPPLTSPRARQASTKRSARVYQFLGGLLLTSAVFWLAIGWFGRIASNPGDDSADAAGVNEALAGAIAALSEARNDRELADAAIEVLRREVTSSCRELRQQKEAMESAESAAKSLAARVTELENEKAACEADIVRLREAAERAVEADVDSWRDALAARDIALRSLEQQTADADASRLSALSSAEAMRSEVARLKADLATAENSRQHSSVRIAELEHGQVARDSEIALLRKEIGALTRSSPSQELWFPYYMHAAPSSREQADPVGSRVMRVQQGKGVSTVVGFVRLVDDDADNCAVLMHRGRVYRLRAGESVALSDRQSKCRIVCLETDGPSNSVLLRLIDD